MLHVHVSNALDALAAPLADSIRARRRAALLEPVVVVVPNGRVRSFVKLELSRRLGVVANLDLPALDGFLRGLVPDGVKVLDRGELESILLELLGREDVLARDALAPVKAWLGAAGDERAVVERRRWQLASRVARALEELALARPDMIETWESGGLALDPSHTQSSTEAWQRELWRLARTEGRDLPALLRGLATFEVPEVVHVFGFSWFAPEWQRLLARLGERATVHVYAFSPCRDGGGEHPAARLWLGPIGEHQAVWRSLAKEGKATIDELWREPSRDALLRNVQSDVLARRAPSPAAADGSITVLACAGIAREVEVVADEIWSLVRATPDLRFDEIAVLLAGPEQESYRSHLVSTFRRAHEIPVTIADGSLARESRIVEAIELLLDLPASSLRRSEVLAAACHPAIAGLFDEAEPERWVGWCDDLAIFHGGSHDDHRGTYVERDLYNWDQGLRRLALGAFVADELDLAEPESVEAGRLVLLARSLLADARFARGASLALAGWASFAARLIESYVAPRDEDEESLVQRCLDRVRAIGERGRGGVVGWTVAREAVRAAISGVSVSRGHDLAEGVVVAPFKQGRPVPFRVAFVLGLGEGAFPAPERRDLLDLASGPSPTDRDRALFLETLASTRDRLYLSYVARDAQTGEPIAPSSVVRELLSILARSLSKDELARVTVTPPFRRWDARAVARTSLLASFEEARARALREDLARALERRGIRRWPEPREIAAVADLLPPRSGGRQGGGPRDDVLRVSIEALQDFLCDPLQGWAEHRLRLREDDPGDPLLADEEPFAPSSLDKTIALREAFFEALRSDGLDRDALEAAEARAWDAIARRFEERGGFPTGVFLDALRPAHLAILETWRANTLRAGLQLADLRALEVHRFGPSEWGGEADVVRAPLALEVAGRRVAIVGRTNRVLAGAAGSLSVVTGAYPAERYSVRGFLDGAVLAAAGIARAPEFRVIVAAGEPKKTSERRWRAFTADEARAWLATVIADLVAGPHAYLLPLKPALDFLRDETTALAPAIEADARGRWGKPFGPVKRLDAFSAPADAEAIARRRLGPYVAREIDAGRKR